MKRRRKGTLGTGRLFRRLSRHTGKELPIWWMSYYVHGREVRKSTHTEDRDRALEQLGKHQQAKREGAPVDPVRERATVDTILDSLLAFYRRQGHRSHASAKSQLDAWREAIGSCRAVSVETMQLEPAIDTWQTAGVSAATINRRLGLLRRAFNLAKIRVDPARLDFKCLFVNEASPRGRFVTADAFSAIHKHLPAYAQDLFEFSYLCGTRKGQLARTKWAHFNLEAREVTWSADEVKAKQPFTLPLDGRPLDIILARYAERTLSCPYIFHGRRCRAARTVSKNLGCIGDIRKSWATACQAAGFPIGRKQGGFVWHNTRHSAVTNLVNAGVPAHEAMAVSGHRTRSVFDRYSIPLKDQTRAALRRTSAYVANLPTNPVVTPIAGSR